MERPWSAEREVPPALAVALIEHQFPDLAPVQVRLLGAGWDNTVYRTNETLVFRFPRRAVAVELIETEARVLPTIAPRLPLPVPVPRYVGKPETRYPWPFLGYAMLTGDPAPAAALDARQRAEAAAPIGGFLAALHAFSAAAAADLGAGPDPNGRFDLARRIPRLREDLRDLARRALIDDEAIWDSIIEAVGRARPARANCLVHGDLGARHLLVDERQRPCGVIDWGDVHIGDPAVDLSIACGFLPPAARDVFARAYGPIDDDTWALARFRALHIGAIIISYGDEIGDEPLRREGLTALHHLAIAARD